MVDDAIRDAEREIEIKDIKHLVTDIESTISDAKERDENSMPIILMINLMRRLRMITTLMAKIT